MGRLKYDIGIKKHSMRSGTLFKLVLAFNSQLSANQDDDELQVRKTNECSDACVRLVWHCPPSIAGGKQRVLNARLAQRFSNIRLVQMICNVRLVQAMPG